MTSVDLTGRAISMEQSLMSFARSYGKSNDEASITFMPLCQRN